MDVHKNDLTSHTDQSIRTNLKTIEFQDVFHSVNRGPNSMDGNHLRLESAPPPNEPSDGHRYQEAVDSNVNHHRTERDIFPFRPLFVYRLFEKRQAAEKRKLALMKAHRPNYIHNIRNNI